MQTIKEKIIHAIQKQKQIGIDYKKENGIVAELIEIAPYDVFPKKTKNSDVERDMLLGYRTDNLLDKGNHITKVYLDNIIKFEIIEDGRGFDGKTLREMINPKKPPMVKRNW
jgi:hypothetical protein